MPEALRLNSPELFLRPLTKDDASQTYVDWLNNPAINRFLETRFEVQSLESVRTFIEAINKRDDEHLFGIFLSETGRHVGTIKVGPIKPHHRVADVSLFIGEKDCWGQGLATNAIRLITGYAFKELGLSKLSASMYAPNIGSLAAFIKAGFRKEGLRRKYLLLDGEDCDMIELGLCPDEYQESSEP
ncbi:MAG: GNAT family N-acetyltransferase [Rhodospirillales bacterium]|nr:GNAT family N-acetyltransferase [Rhodospirillales bacterium]